MSTTSNPQHDDYQALLLERFGPVKELARERAATPAEVIRLPQRRRTEQRRAAA
ncbi:hypothetical protein [Micromonospora tulbaghiae]|uniref:hypothetical protein n=1 Tax=Micromonospora tulbaghiae TaxID=479978 RepID=UPI003430463E